MKLSLNHTLFRLSVLALMAVSLLSFGGALVDGIPGMVPRRGRVSGILPENLDHVPRAARHLR